MKGIIQSGMAPEQEQAAAAPTEAAANEEGESTQDDYDRVVMAASEVLHDDQTNPGIMKILEDGKDDPATTMASIATMVITQLDEQSGGSIPEDVILPATEDILPMVAELASAAKIFTPDERTMNLAMQKTVGSLGEHYGVAEEDIKGLINSMDPTEVQAMVAKQQQYEQPQGA